ncbi:unnamed protein product [Victoria cruziana]
MSNMNKAVVAAGMSAAVQGLRDQAIRFNSILVVLHQNAKRNYASPLLLNGLRLAASDSACSTSLLQRKVEEERSKEAEQSLRKVMYLSCWGPN